MTTISIITCVIGEPEALFRTADSIRPYLSNQINWIIKFSSNTNKSFIEKFSGDFIKLHQQKDDSLYDAMNQCLSLSSSDYYMVLGAGDTLMTEGMQHLIQKIENNSLVDASYHAPLIFAVTGAISNPNPQAMKYFMSCTHPSSLLRVENSLAINGFNLSYRVAADYEHMSRYAVKYGAGTPLNIPPLVSFMGGGFSEEHALEGILEVFLVRMRIWGTPDIRIYGDLLNESAVTISNNIQQNFN